jgi:hypothetical protein
MKSSSSSGGAGVVESWGVDGGAGGGVYGLVEMGLVARSGVDGKTNKLDNEDSSLCSLVAGAGRYLPFRSRHVVFASVADAMLTTRRSTKHSARWNGKHMLCQPRSDVPDGDSGSDCVDGCPNEGVKYVCCRLKP